MTQLMVPRRAVLIARMDLACQVRPLARPRARWHVKGVYQPVGNQQELFNEILPYTALHIDEPVFVDLVVNFKRPKTNKDAHVLNHKLGDVDNLAKAVNDGLIRQKILADDKYIVGQQVTKAYGASDHCHVLIHSVEQHAVEIQTWDLSCVPTSEKPADKLLQIFRQGTGGSRMYCRPVPERPRSWLPRCWSGRPLILWPRP